MALIKQIKKVKNLNETENYKITIITNNENSLINIDLELVLKEIVEYYNIKSGLKLNEVGKFIINPSLERLISSGGLKFNFNENFYLVFGDDMKIIDIPFELWK